VIGSTDARQLQDLRRAVRAALTTTSWSATLSRAAAMTVFDGNGPPLAQDHPAYLSSGDDGEILLAIEGTAGGASSVVRGGMVTRDIAAPSKFPARLTSSWRGNRRRGPT